MRSSEGGLVLQQLLYADEVRSIADLYVERKVAGKQIVTHEHHAAAVGGGQVFDLMEALRASLGSSSRKAAAPTATTTDRRPPQRAAPSSVFTKSTKKSARR